MCTAGVLVKQTKDPTQSVGVAHLARKPRPRARRGVARERVRRPLPFLLVHIQLHLRHLHRQLLYLICSLLPGALCVLLVTFSMLPAAICLPLDAKCRLGARERGWTQALVDSAIKSAGSRPSSRTRARCLYTGSREMHKLEIWSRLLAQHSLP